MSLRIRGRGFLFGLNVRFRKSYFPNERPGPLLRKNPVKLFCDRRSNCLKLSRMNEYFVDLEQNVLMLFFDRASE
jgi:hypothetical protein